MTESRWAHWSPGTLKTGLRTIGQFMEQAPMQAGMGSRSAADEAREAGLTHAGYGYYKDSSGQVVAQSRDGKLVYIDQTQGKMQPSQVDMGNPTGEASGQTPADKARSMGLISDGSGSYQDSEGNTIARTVNNELVFYDSRAGGGAVSDGSGGAQITQSAPSWVDPVTGLIVVPPAQPESPEEINAVPDPTPATAPAGYDAFVNKKKEQMYKDNAIQTEIEQDVAQQQAAVDEAYASHPFMQMTKDKLEEKATAAEESGDEYKVQIGNMVRDAMNENAEQYKSYFDQLPEDQHAVLSDMLVKRTIQQAKHDYWNNNNLDDQYFAPGADREALNKMMPATSLERYDDEIGDMIGQANGLVVPKIRKKNFGDSGKFVNYSVSQGKPQLQSSGEGGSVLPENDEAERAFKELANAELAESGLRYGSKDNPQYFEVEWQVDDDEDAMDEKTKKKAALDALYTWRNKIMPQLKPGMILHNKPTSETRERIYELAGFSPALGGDYKDQQFAVVVVENGKNVLKPLDPTAQQMDESVHWKAQQITENFLNMVDGPLREIAVDDIYGGLFE